MRKFVLISGAAVALLAPAAIVVPAAQAATAAATCASTNNKLDGELIYGKSDSRTVDNDSFTSKIELWYSPDCRYVWAKELDGVENSDPDWADYLYIYNETNGDEVVLEYNSNADQGSAAVTSAINDKNTVSIACMYNGITIENDPYYMPTVCTSPPF